MSKKTFSVGDIVEIREPLSRYESLPFKPGEYRVSAKLRRKDHCNDGEIREAFGIVLCAKEVIRNNVDSEVIGVCYVYERDYELLTLKK